jgi:glycosyltransferase involved in cell wall biosynthesis
MKVSLITVAYNRADTIKDTFDSMNKGIKRATGDLIVFINS